jgi:two-component system, OmpR family, sensor histidine kinase KdpD
MRAVQNRMDSLRGAGLLIQSPSAATGDPAMPDRFTPDPAQIPLPDASSSAPDSRRGGAAGAAAIIALTTAACAALDPWLSIADIAMTYLLAVLLTAIRLGRAAAIIAALIGFLALNFFFTEPRYTFAIADMQNVLTVFYFLAAAVIASDLAARLKAQAEATRRHAARTENLYNFNRRLAAAGGLQAALQAVADHVAATAGGGALVLIAKDDRLEIAAAAPDPQPLDAACAAAAEWAWRNREPAGRGAAIASETPWLFFPLRGSQGGLGALGVLCAGPIMPETRRLLQALADQAAGAVERATLAATVHTAQVEAERERLRAALLSSLSHDLRTPLSSILGAASGLSAYGEALDPAARRELTQTVQEEAERLNRFVQNLLDMTRIGAGDLKPRADWVDAADIIDGALTRAKAGLQDRPLILDLDPCLPLLHADPLLLEQVFVNLLDNAGKYAPPQTPVTISARMTDGQAQFVVADRGPGIPAADRERVFGMFFRLESGDARPAGTGLGLAICRGIIAAHGGSVIAAEGENGVGTRIIVRLPVSPPPLAPDADAEEEARDE